MNIQKLFQFFGFVGAIDVPNNTGTNYAVSYKKPYEFLYKAQDELNMTINFINCPPNVTEMTYTFRSGSVSDMAKIVDLKKPSIRIQTRLMQLIASVSVDVRTLSGSCSTFQIANGKELSTSVRRPQTRLTTRACTCCSPNWCTLTVDFSKGFTNQLKKTYASVLKEKQKRKQQEQTSSSQPKDTRRKSHPSTTTRTYTYKRNFTAFTTQAPVTEDPSKNLYDAPEAVFSIDRIFLYYVLPASICVVLASVVICLCLLIKKHKRSCSNAVINTNNTDNEVLYADLELKGTNNFQRRCNEESPYAQIQISQMSKK